MDRRAQKFVSNRMSSRIARRLRRPHTPSAHLVSYPIPTQARRLLSPAYLLALAVVLAILVLINMPADAHRAGCDVVATK